MKNQLFILSLIAAFSASTALAKTTVAPNRVQNFDVNYVQADNNTKSISAQQAARIVKNKYGGKVLKVNNSGSKKNPSYRVKLLKDNGHVISVNVDGNSGRISGY